MSGPDEHPAPRPRPAFKPRAAPLDNDAIRALATAAAEGTRFDRPAPGTAPATPPAGQGTDAVPAGLPPPIAARRAAAPEPSKKATFDFPASLHKALQHAAVEAGVTMRHIVMQSLSDAGYPVPDDALIPDRRTRRGEGRG